MNPDWNTAPEWADYAAMDPDGTWYWFENDPIMQATAWSPNYGMCAIAEFSRELWRTSKEARP